MLWRDPFRRYSEFPLLLHNFVIKEDKHHVYKSHIFTFKYTEEFSNLFQKFH